MGKRGLQDVLILGRRASRRDVSGRAKWARQRLSGSEWLVLSDSTWLL
jgi:hypothetical protein